LDDCYYDFSDCSGYSLDSASRTSGNINNPIAKTAAITISCRGFYPYHVYPLHFSSATGSIHPERVFVAPSRMGRVYRYICVKNKKSKLINQICRAAFDKHIFSENDRLLLTLDPY
jgi:hypothetical protein